VASTSGSAVIRKTRRSAPGAQSPRRSRSDVVYLGLIAVFAAASAGILALGLAAAFAASSPSFHQTLHELALGTGLEARVAEGMATASHKVQPGPQLALDYLFSGFNLVLALFLLRLRCEEKTARLLATGMIGAAAVLNLQAVSVYEAMPKTPLEVTLFALHQLVTGAAYISALILFPDGKLVPRWPRWAQVVLYAPLSFAVAAVSFGRAGSQPGIIDLILFFGLVTPLAAVLTQAYRYRQSPTPEQRQQSRLLFWALVPALVVGLFVLTQGIRSFLAPGLQGRQLHELPVVVFRIFQPVFSLVPIALFVGLLRYRLWNIDRVISRTLLYGTLVAFVTGAYVTIVVGLGALLKDRANNLLLSIVATGFIAFAFEPAKENLERVANRLVFGKRATPYEVLSKFCERMVDSFASDDLLARMARVLAEGTAATRVEVWLRVGNVLRLEACWPVQSVSAAQELSIETEDLPEMEGRDRAVAVRHKGELLGALTVTKPEGQSLAMTEEKLLDDLASQAGLVLSNMRLNAELLDRLDELGASRQRLVSAQDEERRRIERNLHDGAQQQLVALKLRVAMAARKAQSEAPEYKALFDQIASDTDDALQTLRDLARGIYPPLLAAEGLGVALNAQARKLAIPVEITSNALARFTQEVEAAVYFCCLEAMQNISKHSSATSASITLNREEETLRFVVWDNGRGFDPATAQRSSGLQNMTDRIEALGGRLRVESIMGEGTRTIGEIPISNAEELDPRELLDRV